MGKAELKIEIDADLLKQARAANLQMTLLMERAVREALGPQAAEARARQWATDNAESIASHNRFVEEHGAFGAEWRSW